MDMFLPLLQILGRDAINRWRWPILLRRVLPGRRFSITELCIQRRQISKRVPFHEPVRLGSFGTVNFGTVGPVGSVCHEENEDNSPWMFFHRRREPEYDESLSEIPVLDYMKSGNNKPWKFLTIEFQKEGNEIIMLYKTQDKLADVVVNNKAETLDESLLQSDKLLPHASSSLEPGVAKDFPPTAMPSLEDPTSRRPEKPTQTDKLQQNASSSPEPGYLPSPVVPLLEDPTSRRSEKPKNLTQTGKLLQLASSRTEPGDSKDLPPPAVPLLEDPKSRRPEKPKNILPDTSSHAPLDDEFPNAPMDTETEFPEVPQEAIAIEIENQLKKSPAINLLMAEDTSDYLSPVDKEGEYVISLKESSVGSKVQKVELVK